MTHNKKEQLLITLNQLLSPENMFNAHHHYRTDLSPWNSVVSNKEFNNKPLYYVMKLVDEVYRGIYKADPVRRTAITTQAGKIRRIAALSLQDKVLQRAFVNQFSPKIDGTFYQFSFAYRANRSVNMALQHVKRWLIEGNVYVLYADIKNCFDDINIGKLQNIINKLIPDKQVNTLVNHWLTEHASQPSWLLKKARGIPQGSVIAPILCNLYLNSIDQYFAKENVNYCRFADDILMLSPCERILKKQHKKLNKKLDCLNLSLNAKKVYLGKATAKVKFLGKPLTC